MNIKNIAKQLARSLPILKHFYRTRYTAAPITLKTLFTQKILGINKSAYWPMHFTSTVRGAAHIQTGIGTAPGLSPGCYIQGTGGITIGDYTLIGPNVGIISINHNPTQNKDFVKKEVRIGKYCWIGMNSTILPGVTLGDFTIVGAGTVVTKSFPDGYCIIAGNPAKVIKQLNPKECVHYTNPYEYCGYKEKKNN